MEEIIGKVLQGDLSEKEKKQFYSWLNQKEENKQNYFELRRLWVKLTQNKQNDNLNLDIEFENFWAKVKDQEETKKPRRLIFMNLLKYSAIFIVLLGSGWMIGTFVTPKSTLEITKNQTNRIIAPKGSMARAILPDGSKVWLNSGSELIYSANYFTQSRKVKLNGEAYFEVVHNEANPFIVDVDLLKVKVLGTSFNVMAYPESRKIETTLVDGLVNILNQNDNDILQLSPGKNASYNVDTKKLTISGVDTELYTAWKDGKFVFQNQTLGDICNELEMWYDIKFQFENEAIKSYRYTGKIKRTTTVKYILKMLKITTDFNYIIKENLFTPDEITIYE